METRKTPLLPEHYYHIYNRGINGQNIFFEAKNYSFFLQKYAQFIGPLFDTFAYCLLKNHFHFMVRAKNELQIKALLKVKHQDKNMPWILSNAFASLFKSYSQAINKSYHRTGGLFEEPFHRIVVDSDSYFTQLIYYIHQNPQKHGFVSDFRDYPYSSYHSFTSKKPTKLMREEVCAWFGGEQAFTIYHTEQKPLNDIDKWGIEV